MLIASLVILSALSSISSALDPNCAPGGNFDLSKWTLQLPTGSTGSPTTISSAALQGCDGYQDHWFRTQSTEGYIIARVPGSPASSGCVTTPNSKHCRTELRESSPSKWSPNNPTNKLSVTLAIVAPDESKYGTVIGQIHIDDSISTKPVCELYYNRDGVLTMGVEQTRAGGNSIFTPVGSVPVGTKFTYSISYASNVLKVTINSSTTTLSTYQLNAPDSYFKVGNYNQGDEESDVHIYAISVQH